MKKSLLPVALTITLLSLQISMTRATPSNFPIVSSASECISHAPAVPDIPQDEDILCADVNQDGVINVLDIITLVNHVMGGTPDPFNTDAADINADGVINVLDIISMINIIMQVPGIPCPCNPTVNYEGQVYNTVQIGEQCWFRENLNIGTMISSNTGGQLQTNNNIIEKYCYDNVAVNCTTYGGLYEWDEAMQYATAEGAQGICPSGWHVPTDNEWKILEGAVDSQYPVGDPEWDKYGNRGFDAGGNLKEIGIIHWSVPNTGATNLSGFTSIPGGIRHSWGVFGSINNATCIHSSSKRDSLRMWYRSLAYNIKTSGRYGDYFASGMSVRCLKGGCIPPQADAGGDTAICEGGTYTLTDATASNYAALLWTTSGTGSFNDPTSLNPT